MTRWHEQIGDPTVADGILDRLVHNAHRIEMRGDSMRKKRGTSRRANARRVSPVLRRGKGLRPFPRTPFPAGGALPPLRSGLSFSHFQLDEAEHFPHNQKASVATLRWVFGFIPECCSASFRNRVRLRRNPHPKAQKPGKNRDSLT